MFYPQVPRRVKVVHYVQRRKLVMILEMFKHRPGDLTFVVVLSKIY